LAAQARSEASVEIDLVEIVELARDEDALLNTDHSREVLRLKKEHARRPNLGGPCRRFDSPPPCGRLGPAVMPSPV
jgi:hypothetical protein